MAQTVVVNETGGGQAGGVAVRQRKQVSEQQRTSETDGVGQRSNGPCEGGSQLCGRLWTLTAAAACLTSSLLGRGWPQVLRSYVR